LISSVADPCLWVVPDDFRTTFRCPTVIRAPRATDISDPLVGKRVHKTFVVDRCSYGVADEVAVTINGLS
jgi:hypothetical protein